MDFWSDNTNNIFSTPYPQTEKLKSHEIKEGWMKNDEGWMTNDKWWMMNDEVWWFQAV